MRRFQKLASAIVIRIPPSAFSSKCFVASAHTAAHAIEVRGAENVARGASSFSRPGLERRIVLVNGAPGVVGILDGTPMSVMAFSMRGGKIVEIHILGDRERIARLDLRALA